MRHAESEANAAGGRETSSDSPLTLLGHAQAERLADAFRDVPLAWVATSPSRRAIDTAARLASACGVTPRVRDALREPGTGRKASRFADPAEAATILERLRSGATDTETETRPAPAETHRDVVTRLRAFVREIEETPDEGAILVVSHYVTLNVLVRLLLDPSEPPAAVWASFDNGSVTRVDVPREAVPFVGVVRFLGRLP